MIKIEYAEVVGWKHAIRGMRNPMNSWEKSDSAHCNDREECDDCPMLDDIGHCNARLDTSYIIGPEDHKLMMNLRNAGTDHRKFMRMIAVYVDITAPLYWWKEFDTYKVGTVANSCSTMHKIHEKAFSIKDFSCERLYPLTEKGSVDKDLIMSVKGSDANDSSDLLGQVVWYLNYWRTKFLETKDKKYWWQMIQLLPSSYNQRRTVMLNYEVLANMYRARKSHKLDEWREFCKWIEGLPYSELITGEVKRNEQE